MDQNNNQQYGYQEDYTQQYQQESYPQQYSQYQPSSSDEYVGDPKFEPLGAWAYFGYSLLFSIPVAGFILLIVFSFNNDNINRRNYARSYWCGLLIVGIIFAVIAIFAVILGASIFSAFGYSVSR